MTVESAHRKMAPALAALDVADGGLVNAEVLGNFALRSRVVQDRNDGALIEFSGRVPHAADGSSVGNGVGHVVFAGAPAEIGDLVVCPVAVDVAHIQADPGIPSEGRQDEPVNPVLSVTPLLRETDLDVPVGIYVRAAVGPWEILGATAGVSNYSLLASDPAEAGHGVEAFVPECGHPLFGVGFHGLNYDSQGGLL